MTVGLVLAATVALVDMPGGVAATISADAKKSFIASVVPAAQKAQRSYGVPASVSIAQAILNSEWGTSSVARSAKNYFDTPCSAAMTATQFASLADNQVGKPYVLGAEAAIGNTDPAKFDCSELVEWLFGRSGNPITDLAAAQYNVTKKVTGKPAVGDLVFLRNNPARSNGIGHVAILTKKLSNGDWRIIEARGRAYGVVRTTLSYWKQRSYYAGLRRYSSFVLAGSGSVSASASSIYQSGCTTISGTKYAKFSSATDSFAGHAIAVAEDSKYSTARSVIGNVPAFVAAIAKAEQPKTAGAYADKINQVIDDYDLRGYDVVPFTVVLDSGDTGAKVTATQYLLGAAGHTVSTSGKFDSATVAAVKKFQKSKGLEADGEAGPKTLGALSTKLSAGAKGSAVTALTTLLGAAGYTADSGTSLTEGTTAAVKAFQKVANRPVTGTVDSPTWAALYMTLTAAKPTVSGKPAVGQTLKAGPGSWGPGAVSLSYQWYRGATAIAGATKSSFAVTIAEAGSALSVRVTGIKRLYTTTVRLSAPTATVPLLTLSAAPTPKVSGTAKVGSSLTASAGTWSPAPVALGYQWYRGGSKIVNATKATYTVSSDDAGAALSVAVTATKAGYVTVTRMSTATARVPKVLTADTPTISGTAKVGSTLTAEPGTWGPATVRLSYQWYRGSTAIKGATKSSMLVHSTEAGATISVRVTGTLTGYTAVSRTSAATDPVAKGTIIAVTPKISGTRKSGHTLKVDGGNWGPGAVTLSYRWYRGSSAVKGATKTSYKLTSKDKGTSVSVLVRGSKANYTTVEKKVTVAIAK